MAVTIYGIKNCDTMKKARAWLDKKGVAYDFHDYKAAGIDRGRLEGWAGKVGWETLLNRAGTTFRKLPDKDKEGLSEKKAIALMLAQPSMSSAPCSMSAASFWSASSRSSTSRPFRVWLPANHRVCQCRLNVSADRVALRPEMVTNSTHWSAFLTRYMN